jgi:hypothetical protein
MLVTEQEQLVEHGSIGSNQVVSGPRDPVHHLVIFGDIGSEYSECADHLAPNVRKHRIFNLVCVSEPLENFPRVISYRRDINALRLESWQRKIAELSDAEPRPAIERMFDSIIRRTGDPSFPRGCLNTNTSLECPTAGDEIAAKIAGGFGQHESAIYDVLRQAQVSGLLDSSYDARALARFFMTVAQGMNVVNKAIADPGILTDVCRVAITVWDATTSLQKHSVDAESQPTKTTDPLLHPIPLPDQERRNRRRN